MVASTPLEKVKGETNVAGETIPISVEGEEAITPMDNEVLKEGQGVEGNCKFGGITADRGICIATCRKYVYRGYQYCANHKCWCAMHAGSCPCLILPLIVTDISNTAKMIGLEYQQF